MTRLARVIFLIAALFAIPLLAAGQVLINEAMSSNADGLTDEDGDHPDWIELYNAGPDPVDLAGWGLSDDYGEPFRWTFPAVTIAPGGWVVVLASGKDRRPADGDWTGGVMREVFEGIGGADVDALLTHPRYPDQPDDRHLLRRSFETPVNVDDAYGQRVHGHIEAPQTGAYRFWIAGDDAARLYLSTDASPANAAEIASVPGWTNPREWTKYAAQQSEPIALVQGQRYYIAAVMKDDVGSDHLSVAWELPDGTTQGPIPGDHLHWGAPELHADFAISASGEELLLTAPGGVRVDEVVAPAMPRDISYGRQPDGADAWAFFDAPTPGAANAATGYAGVTDPPTFSQTGGFYTDPVALTLAPPSTDPDAEVYYTLDGSDPDPERAVTYGPNLVENPSFETPLATSVPWPGYFHDQTPPVEIPGWTFTGSYGLNNNLGGSAEEGQRSPFHGEGRPIPDGDQALFQQGADAKTAAQTIAGIEDGKVYEIVLHTAIRPGNAGMDLRVTFGALELLPETRFTNNVGTYMRLAYLVHYDSGVVGAPTLTFHSSYGPGGDVSILYDQVLVREVLSDAGVGGPGSFGPSDLGAVTYTYKNSYPENPGDAFGPLLTRSYQTHRYAAPIAIADRSSEPNQLSAINAQWTRQPQLPWGPVFKGTAVRARAAKPGHLPSEIVTHTYFVHPDIHTRFHQDIVSIVTNEKHFFDYETGIYVAGKAFDDWRTANPDNTADWWLFGNYYGSGRLWERPAHVELFEQGTGARLLSQNVGVRIHGGSSRIRTPKSFRFYARNDYDEADLMEYPFFPGATTKHSGAPLETFKRIMLRTGGHIQDHLRDVPAHLLMQSTRVDMMRARPVVHFLNGEFLGMSHIRDRFDQHHLAHNYGVDPENVIILEGPNTPVGAEAIDEGLYEDLALYNDLYAFVAANDISVAANYAQVASQLDIDSYIDLQVAFIYLNNWDWQGSKHFKFWRVRETSAKPYHDGKWRTHAWDFDASPRAQIPGNVYADFDFDLVINAIHPTGGGNGWTHGSAEKTLFLRKLLENTTFYRRFLNRFADHINTTFEPDRVKAVVTAEYDKVAPDNADFANSFHRDAVPESTRDDWLQFADVRPGYVRDQIVQHFGLAGTAEVTLDVSGAEHGHVRVNTVEIQPGTAGVGDPAYPWSGVYFVGVPIEIEAVAAPGYAFSHWEGLPAGTPAQATAALTGDVALTAHFVEAEASQPIHYWHFNNLPDGDLGPVAADYTVPGGAVISYPGTGDGYMDSVSDGTDINARLDAAPGDGLRVRNPSDTRELVFEMPTTGFERVVFSYATVRTSKGARTQTLWYRPEAAGPWIPLGDPVTVTEDYALVTRDLSGIAEADDNAAFAVRILFEGPEAAGGSGNDRFDNAALDGFPLAGLNLPPLPTGATGLAQAIEGGAPVRIDMDALFDDPEDDPLTFDVSVNKPANATVSAEGATLTVTPLLRGDAVIEVTADDGTNGPVPTTFRVLIYPEAAALRHGGFSFREWDPNHPENVYPAHMLFLQSDVDDPGADAPLLYPYYIAHDDYHANDADKIGFPYQLTGRTRLNGLGDDGIAFINTGRGRDLGGALLALDTRELQAVTASWLAGTLLPNARVYGIRLQYRTSLEAPFTDVLVDGQPAVYVRDVEGHTQAFGPVPLPDDALGQPYVQVMWRYFHISGTSGSRAQLRLDEIAVEAPVGSIQVVIGPSPALSAGAMWSIDGGATWHESGETITVPAGEYTLIFSDVPGRHAPEPRTVTVGAGELTVLSAAYSPLLPAAGLVALALTATALLAAVGALRRRAMR